MTFQLEGVDAVGIAIEVRAVNLRHHGERGPPVVAAIAHHHAEIKEYKDWEGYALYLGPVVSYRRDNWWATLSVMPQIYGANFNGDPDGVHALELEGHEKINVRLLIGFSF